MKPNLGLADADREGVIRLLSPLLADEQVLYAKTRNYHWNVVGIHFHQLHKLFEEQYEALNETIDEVAERVRQLGGTAIGTLTEYLSLARLKEEPGKVPPAREMLAALLADHEAVIRELRGDVDRCAEFHDAGTQDFLTGIMEEHEKMAWMLRAHLES